MSDEIRLNWDNVGQLLSLCVEFKERHGDGEAVDPIDAAEKIAQVFGIDDLGRFAQQALASGFESGFGAVFDEGSANELTTVFAGACGPVVNLVTQFARGEANSTQFVCGLNNVCFGSVESLQAALQHSLGIPDEAAQLVSDKLGPYMVSVYCFAAAFKIYRKAAEDAQLAKERRVEIERLADEALARLKEQRAEMEAMVNGYLLDRLEPFSRGIDAMDAAVLAQDDDTYIAANSQLWELFGRKSQYKTALEFDDLMLSDEAFRL